MLAVRVRHWQLAAVILFDYKAWNIRLCSLIALHEMKFTALPILLSLAVPVAAQTSAQDDFRDRLEQVPVLPTDRVELELDAELALGRVSAITSDDHGNLYVFNRREEGDPIVVLGAGGRLLRSWGEGLFNIPHGIRIDPAGDVWTVDANLSKIHKFSSTGELLLDIQLERPALDQDFCGATDVAFLPDGHVLVSDGYCNGRVVEFDPRGNRLGEWGERGTGPGQFRVAHSIAVGPDQVVYVADRENGRLQRFDRSGRLLGIWEYARQLYSVAFSEDGSLYISIRLPDEPRNHVIRIDPASGEMLGRVSLDCLGHELAVAADGTLLPGLLCPGPDGSVVLYRYRN